MIVKKLWLIKKQETSGLLSTWELKAPLSKFPLKSYIFVSRYTINKIRNIFLLAGDKFMSEEFAKEG